MTSSRIVAWMVAAIVLLGGVVYWDEREKAAESLADFATEQVLIARAAGNVLHGVPKVTALDADPILDAATRLRALEQPGRAIVLLRPPGSTDLLTLDGAKAVAPSIAARFAHGGADSAWVRLSHDEAAQLGLLPRTAIAALAEVDRSRAGHWGLVVVSTAQRERDREERGLWRVGLGFFVASAIVVTFGTLALKKQRAELDLERRLAVAEAVHARDERLVRADKLASLGAFAMGIAHQVATPLGVIVGRSERLMPRVASDERAQKAVAAIAEQAARINRIIRAFLSLARGGAPALERVEPQRIAEAAMDLVRHRFEKAGVDVAFPVAEPLPRVACDPRLFEQVLVNLLLNACDACDDGGRVTMTIAAEGDTVVFTVDDDGVGIDPAVADQVAEPFFTTKAEDAGSGLGLAIAREIVVHHRGTLTFAPRAPRGTRARVEIPASAGEDDA